MSWVQTECRQSAEETSPLSMAVFRLLPPLGPLLRPRPTVVAALDRFLPRAGLGVDVPSSTISFPVS
jgi:hypothetical protein